MFSGEMKSLKKKPGKRRLWECVELKRRIKGEKESRVLIEGGRPDRPKRGNFHPHRDRYLPSSREKALGCTCVGTGTGPPVPAAAK